jgi:hypothetical protein
MVAHREAVVGAHNFLNPAFGNKGLEGREIGGMEVTRTDRHVELMAVPFRAAMYGVMFGTGVSFIVLEVVTLQAFDGSQPDALCEEGVFTVGFHGASPSRISQDVDIGCPESQTIVRRAIIVAQGKVIFGASFIADEGEGKKDSLLVESSVKGNSLRKNGGLSCPRHTV